MTEARTTAPLAPAPQARSGWWWLGLVFWTFLVGAVAWWLGQDSPAAGDTVIRFGPGESKSWIVRLQETLALVRLNSPWALAWLILAPYVLFVGVRFSFEPGRWRTRLPLLLGAGVGFVWTSQWLSARFDPGRTMIVMVNYSEESTTGNRHRVEAFSGVLGRGPLTNHLITNRFTQVVIAGEAAPPTNFATWELAEELPAGLRTNLPSIVADKFVRHLPPTGPARTRGWSPALDALAYIALLGLAHAGVFHRRYRERESQAAALAAQLDQARLRALQAQLQPHFLFNTLNGIATLLRRDPRAAEEMLISLSDLLRIALSSSERQEIPLREELDFLERYLEIQRMRFGDRLQVREEIEPAARECLVPALLLQPVVENAIRHGLEPAGRVGELRVTAARDGDWLRLSISDNGVGLPPGELQRAGHGLANVRERLATLHGGAHEFTLTNRTEGGVIVTIKLPARVELVAAVNGSAPHPDPLPQGEGTAIAPPQRSQGHSIRQPADDGSPCPGGEGRGEGERANQPHHSA